jgi:hypothetical protein
MIRSAVAFFLCLIACGDDAAPRHDAGRRDGGSTSRDAAATRDAGRDASIDSGLADGDSGVEPTDAGMDGGVDSGIETIDAGSAPDAGDFCIPSGLSCAGAIGCCEGLTCCGAPVFPPGFELCFEMCP